MNAKLDEKLDERAKSREKLLELRRQRAQLAATIEREKLELEQLERKVLSERKRLVEVTQDCIRLLGADVASMADAKADKADLRSESGAGQVAL